MASIGTLFPAASNNGTANAAASNDNTNANGGANALANQTTFLNLLVEQLKNQDPTNPVNGTEFITQLAEFNNVQQSLAIRQDLDAISAKYLGTTTPPSSGSGNHASPGSPTVQNS
jgi:flagellar hook assembly protein FlgD